MLLHQLISAFFQATAVSGAGFIVAILAQFLRKLGMTLSAQQEAKFRYHVEGAILTVEETSGNSLTTKLSQAVELVKAKVPSKTEQAIENAIHAELSRQRADAGNVLFKPKS